MADKVFNKLPAGINVASGFLLQAQTPLDARGVVETIADRDALVAENGSYEGMPVYVRENSTLYIRKEGYWDNFILGDISINGYAGFQEIVDILDETREYAATLEQRITALTDRIAELEKAVITV